MILYHGTSGIRGTNILKDSSIRKASDKVYGKDHAFPTTDGYVYLTNDLINAIYYGNKTAWNDNDGYIFIFRVDIEKSILEPDEDEIKYTLQSFGQTEGIKDISKPTLEESLKETLSARLNTDINFKKFKVSHTKILSSFPIDANRDRSGTKNIVGLVSKNNEYAQDAKDEFIKKLEWI